MRRRLRYIGEEMLHRCETWRWDEGGDLKTFKRVGNLVSKGTVCSELNLYFCYRGGLPCISKKQHQSLNRRSIDASRDVIGTCSESRGQVVRRFWGWRSSHKEK